ncbi:extracellular solute-binding protein [Ruania rhizosphaerae]|uniref:ABC transporter substrate-binding protein n=1 Tax=Ruania rhizosphaerae TaxID=1840413 RepID=UPI00135AC3FE|nr:ABC transporter substrate-binding protein [Ruania rhizosphaerae]
MPRRTLMAPAIGALSLSIALAACGGSDEGTGEEADGEVTLTVATFNDFGYTDELFDRYEAEHPGVTIVHNRAATSNDARANFFSKLGSGGLADIEAVEVDWVPEIMEYSDLLADLSDPELEGRWLDWKVESATDADGRLIGYGTDVGPQSVCYRADLFAEAGLPTDREEVAALLEGDWDTYFEVGHTYVEATGNPWFDTGGGPYQAMVNQIAAAYEDPETNEIIVADNAEVRAAYDQALTEGETLSANLGQWGDDWRAGIANGAFATMLCPGWMLGVIEGNAADVEGWDIANVFPGGGGNWGGSYLTVPGSGANVEAAQDLAAWLTSPEAQLEAFANVGAFPSQPETYDSVELLESTNDYFNDAPIGEILIDRANAVTVAPYKGPNYFAINDALHQAITRVEDGSQSAEESWEQFLSDVETLN